MVSSGLLSQAGLVAMLLMMLFVGRSPLGNPQFRREIHSAFGHPCRGSSELGLSGATDNHRIDGLRNQQQEKKTNIAVLARLHE